MRGISKISGVLSGIVLIFLFGVSVLLSNSATVLAKTEDNIQIFLPVIF